MTRRYTKAEREEAALICAILASSRRPAWWDAVNQLGLMGRRKNKRIRELAHRASWRAISSTALTAPTRVIYAEAEAIIRNNEI